MNPVLPLSHFVPDGEARRMPDGRLYVYGSYDISGSMDYCSDVLHAFSTDDMIRWTDHGVCFCTADVPWAKAGCKLYAPDCIHRDGKTYLYFCLSDGSEGVAVSETPGGPFSDVRRIDGIAGIDPAVFIDDDDQAYYYWGQFSLSGAKLNADMATLEPGSIVHGLIDEKRCGFHEGASLRKRGGIYYLVFSDISRGRPTCLGYATSRSPLGPFEYRGIIVDNMGCDPETWNNHGSIGEYDGQWYVFYHRSSQNSRFCRRLCIEPIAFAPDGSIREVVPTTQGVEPPLPADGTIAASRACRIGGWGATGWILPDERCPGEEVLASVTGNGWAAYRYVDFGRPVNCAELTLESDGSGEVEIWTDTECLGTIPIRPTNGERAAFSAPLCPASGVQTLYLEWKIKKNCSATLKNLRMYMR